MTCSLSIKDRYSDPKTKLACKIPITKLNKGKSLPESSHENNNKQDSDAKQKKPNLMKRKSLSDGYGEKKKKKQDSHEKEMKHSSFSAPLVIKEPSEHDSDAKQKKPKRKSTSESYDEKMKKPLILDDEPEEFTTKMLIGESSRSSCGICFDLKTDFDMFKRKSCNHLFCVDCISKYVDSQLSNNVVKVTCPTPNCSAKLLPRHLQHILPDEFIDRWQLAKYESKIALEQKTYCAFKDCSVLLVNDNDRGVVLTSCECPSCHRLFCAQCKVPWHAEMNCQEFQDSKRDKNNEIDLDDKFLELAKSKKWQRCPNCSIYVKRSSGCEEMKCRFVLYSKLSC